MIKIWKVRVTGGSESIRMTEENCSILDALEIMAEVQVMDNIEAIELIGVASGVIKKKGKPEAPKRK